MTSSIRDNTEISGGVIHKGIFFPKKNLASGTLRVILSSACNFQCQFCFSEGENKKPRTLDQADICSVLRIAREYGITKIKLSGGEPLLYPQLEDVLRIIRELKFEYVDITTNASALNDKMIALLNRHQVNAITISLSSMRKSVYEEITGFKNYELIERHFLSALTDFNGRTRINAVVFNCGNTLEDYIRIIEICLAKGCGLRIVEPTTVKELPMTYDKGMFLQVRDYLLHKAERVVVSDCASVEYAFWGNQYITIMKSLCDNLLCESCKEYMYVRLTSDGKLKPCLARTDTEESLDFKDDSSIRKAFILAIHNVGNGLKQLGTHFSGVPNPYSPEGNTGSKSPGAIPNNQ